MNLIRFREITEFMKLFVNDCADIVCSTFELETLCYQISKNGNKIK